MQVQASQHHDDVPRGVTFQLRLTLAEREALKAAAQKRGLKLSEFIRQCCGLKTTTTETVVVEPPAVKRRNK